MAGWAAIVESAAEAASRSIRSSVVAAINSIQLDRSALRAAYEAGRYAAAADAFDWREFESDLAERLEVDIYRASQRTLKQSAGKVGLKPSDVELEDLAAKRAAQTAKQLASESRAAMKNALQRMGRADVGTSAAVSTAREIAGLNTAQANSVVTRATALRSEGATNAKVKREVEALSARQAKARGINVAKFEGMAAAGATEEEVIRSAIAGGEIAGAKQTWHSQRGPTTCQICRGLHGQSVAFGKKFKYRGKSYSAPPIHSSCQCEREFSIQR